MGRSATVSVKAEKGVELPPDLTWIEVYTKDYQPEASTYRGTCNHEDDAFLIDPLKLLISDWQKWAREDLPKEIEAKYASEGATPLRLKIYIGSVPVLWGLGHWPAIRVESWYHGSPILGAIIAAIILVVVVWAFLAWLFQKLEQTPWLPALFGLGGLIILGILIYALSGKVEKKVGKK